VENDDKGQQTACHECDLLITLPHLEVGSKAVCPRCGYILTKRYKNSLNRILAFSVTSIVFLVVSSLFPFLSFSSKGQDRTVTLLQSIDVLVHEGQLVLAIMILVAIIVIPAIFLFGLLYILAPLKHSGTVLPYAKNVLRFILALTPWSMVEIFLIGMMVSLVKVSSLADVAFGLSFWAYILFTLFMTLVLLHVDKIQLWQWMEKHVHS
jgi:paraquat-inducible protein A